MKLEDVDRTMYETLRAELVTAGLIVDITSFPADTDAYQVARRDLAQSNGLGEVAELFGVGNPKKRDTKTNAKVTVNRKDQRPGAVGASPEFKFLPVVDLQSGETTFNKYMMWDQTYSITYEIRTAARNVSMDRLLQQAIDRVFGLRRFIPCWSSITTAFTIAEEDMLFVRLSQSAEVSSAEDMIERVIRIEVDDVFISDMRLLESGIAEMSEVIPTIGGAPFPAMTAQQFVNVSGLSCANLNDPVSGLTYDQLVQCLIRRYDFSDTNTQNRLTDGQVAQLIAWLGSSGPPPDPMQPTGEYLAYAIGHP